MNQLPANKRYPSSPSRRGRFHKFNRANDGVAKDSAATGYRGTYVRRVHSNHVQVDEAVAVAANNENASSGLVDAIIAIGR
jgi:hypothetical protein